MKPLRIVLILAPLCSFACIDASPTSATLLPTPIILPDAATIGVGAAQVFSVRYAAVTRFEVVGNGQNWSDCVAVDLSFAETNSIRLVARTPCRGLIYVSAMIGDHKSPLVAALKVQ